MPTKLDRSTKSAVIAFEPRQVTLAKHNMAKKVTLETPGNDSKGKTLTIEQKLKKSKKKKSMNSSDKALLFHSIAAYLDGNGFSKTLSAFRSEALSELHYEGKWNRSGLKDFSKEKAIQYRQEAQQEKAIDDWKGQSLDLEEMYNKYLESSGYHVEANVNRLMEPEIADLRKDGDAEKVEGGNNFDVSEELTKKKRKKNNEGDANSLNVKLVAGNGFAKCVDDLDGKLADEVGNHIHVKSKEKKKKHKLEVSEEPADFTSHELQSDELNKSTKDKKKKKSKLIPGSDPEDIEQSQSKTSREAIKEKSNILTSSEDKCKIDGTGLDAADVQSKGKKKSKAISDTFLENTEDVVLKDVQEVGKRKLEDLESSRGENYASSVTKLDADGTSGLVPLDQKNVKSKDKKKKKDRCFEDKKEFDQEDAKKIDFVKGNLQTKGDDGVEILDKSSKKRKRLVSEETKSQWDEETGIKEAQLRKDEGPEEGKGSQQHPKEATSIEVDGNATKKRKTQNGHIDSKNSREMSVDNQLGGQSEKMIKKLQNGLAEPKTVNAFQRVKVEEVKFVDERLQDNSYWAKDGADSGYGAKAQEVLGQVRGRDFRHEKTKKKRGSYRGGQIDLQSHSVKFNYSDDE